MTLLRLFWAFFKIGALGFGGGMAIIRMISDCVGEFVAMTPDEFSAIVGITQVTPGPVAVNMATFIGYIDSGLPGALLATIGVCLPAFIIITVVCRTIDRHRENKLVQGALTGVKPATAGMIAASAITVGRPVLFAAKPLGAEVAGLTALLPQGFDLIAVVICLATVILIGKYKVNAFRVLIVMALIGAVLGA